MGRRGVVEHAGGLGEQFDRLAGPIDRQAADLDEALAMIAHHTARREAVSIGLCGNAEALIAGPRKAVKGPFIPLLRSPVLMDRTQHLGEYLRFSSAINGRLSELAILIVATYWR